MPVSQTPVFQQTAALRRVRSKPRSFQDELARFAAFETQTIITTTELAQEGSENLRVPTFTNEFWTSKQRAAHSLHEVSYRACFKPQLPRFFIERFTKPNDVVYDPFMGRGTTLLEAALLRRHVIGNDINPLSHVLIQPRLAPPTLDQIQTRLNELDLSHPKEIWKDLRVFYHPETLREIAALREYFLRPSRELDHTDQWIRMVALNRLTGHSPGFFSVYTLPPNQAVSIQAQIKINATRQLVPPRRAVKEIILKKSRALLKDCDQETRDTLAQSRKDAKFFNTDSEATPEIKSESVNLIVTSPPFLDVVDYAAYNWLRNWFLGIDAAGVPISLFARVEDWSAKMARVFLELRRLLKPNGVIAFEVGEVRGGKVLLENVVIQAAQGANLEPELVLINRQKFTKTANAWGVSNNAKGTNTNRIVLLRRKH